MASHTPSPECKPYEKEAQKALNKRSLWAGFREAIEREPGGVELLTLRNRTPIELPASSFNLSGRWSLHFAWSIRRVPGGDAILWRSSFGLNVSDIALAPKGERVCLVRYDVDNDHPGPGLGAIGAHLNVLQPAPLDDHIHYPVLAAAERAWSVSEVLDVFLSPQFVKELRDRLGP